MKDLKSEPVIVNPRPMWTTIQRRSFGSTPDRLKRNGTFLFPMEGLL
ncbi:MAG: hypothetical protein NNA31_01710 [Nitrospira sp.]|nr:hypothetical protein [Nitrospira sp.]